MVGGRMDLCHLREVLVSSVEWVCVAVRVLMDLKMSLLSETVSTSFVDYPPIA